MIDIVFTHNDFYIALKPPQLNFHDEGALGSGFFNRLKAQLEQTIYPVHRLDKLTSGLIIVARNKRATQWFQTAFEQNQIEKLYLACSMDKPKKKQGTIIGDMAKARNGAWKLLKTKNNPAMTQFFSWGDPQSSLPIRWFLVKPESGKTHQIRVALKSIGAAILGDELYGGVKAERGYLHALCLRFEYVNGEKIEISRLPQKGEYFLNMPSTVSDAIKEGFGLAWPRAKR